MSLDELYMKLKYNKEDIHIKGDSFNGFSSRMSKVIEKLDYDSIYFLNNEPIIIFKEFNSLEENQEEIQKLSREFWNLGEIPILFIKLNNQYILYNAHIFDKDKDNIWKEFDIDDEESLNEFEYLNLVSNKFWKDNEKDFEGKYKVDCYLLSNLNMAKKILLEKNLSFETITSVIGRLILSRYLIDRNILRRDNFQKIYNKDFEDIICNKEELYSFFDFVKEKFNGDIFQVTQKELNEITEEHLKILSYLFKGNDLGNGQSVLFDVYDFSIIPIEFISNIYETFLSTENKRNKGIYYTPLFLVDYIIENTVSDKLKDNDTCKILDPSCGSGIFLVESLRKLIEKQDFVNSEILNSLVEDNIFGIDIDENAINISIFSIYITLLDYVEDFNNFKFPLLKNRNFFKCDFFDEKLDNINCLRDFDCIIGNPPWFKAKGEKKLFEVYCNNKKINIANRQIAEAFIPRASDFLDDDGVVSLIVTSKILYNVNDYKFREYLLNNFHITKFFDLTLVRQDLFKNSNWPAVIIFYKNIAADELIEDNHIEFISLKPNIYLKLNKIVIETRDIKNIKQKDLMDYDWLFKVLLVGNSLDFNFIKRLKHEFITLDDFINKHSTLQCGVGFKKGNENGTDVSLFYNLPYLNMKNNDLTRYHVNPTGLWKYNYAKSGNINLMEPPYVLMKQSYTPDFDFISAFSDEKLVFDFNTFAIKGNEEDSMVLKNIMACINSNLFKYFFLMTGNVGIEKNRGPFSERKSFPFSKKLCADTNLFNLVESRENLLDDSSIVDYENQINNTIYNCYDLSDFEKNLIDYAINVTIPIINRKYDVSMKVDNDLINRYISVILKSLNNFFRSKNFHIDVYITELLVCISFNIVDESYDLNFHEDNDINIILNMFDDLSYEKIGELFIKRDYKIINDDSFAIIKTNEYFNWHEAIAWLDAGEFLQLFFNEIR